VSVIVGAPRWPVVVETDWCGDGVDASSFASFSPVVTTQIPAAAMPVWIAPNPNPGRIQTHINAPGSYLIRTGAGWTTGIEVNTVVTNGQMTCYDGIDATGIMIAAIDCSRQAPSPSASAPWGFQVGFFVVVVNNPDITIVTHSF
jgi:hypothetical protein